MPETGSSTSDPGGTRVLGSSAGGGLVTPTTALTFAASPAGWTWSLTHTTDAPGSSTEIDVSDASRPPPLFLKTDFAFASWTSIAIGTFTCGFLDVFLSSTATAVPF